MANTIRSELEDVIRQGERIKEAILDAIQTLPDNPQIKRLPGGNAFIIQSSKLKENWSPEYHDFKRAYRLIADVLENGDIKTLPSRLEAIIKNGYIMYNQSQRLNLHPEVLKNLATVLDSSKPKTEVDND